MIYKIYFKISIIVNNFFYIFAILIQKFKKEKHILTAVYDLRQNSLSYNFFQFLVGTEIHRLKFGFKKIELFIINKHRKKKYRWSSFYDSFKKNTLDERTFNLLPQLSSLFPEICKIRFIDKREFEIIAFRNSYFPVTLFPNLPAQYVHLFDLEKLKNSDFMPIFLPNKQDSNLEKMLTEWLLENSYFSFFTYTIRNSNFDKNRNSNVHYLPKLKKWLHSLKIGLIIIPDSEKNNLKNNGNKASKIGTLGAKDVANRLYIYQKSNLNIFVPNGPAILCIYSINTPYIILNLFPKNSIVKQDTKWFNSEKNKTFWSDSEFQKLTNYQDNFEDVKSAIIDLINHK